MEERRRARCAQRAAEAGASVAVGSFRRSHEIDLKSGPLDQVTQADRNAQTAVVETVHDTFPDEPVVGEEDDAPKTVPPAGPAWIVDPIDGTTNYLRGVQLYATAVAAVVDGEPVGAGVVLPSLDDAFRSGPDGAFRNERRISVSDRADPAACVVSPTMWWSDEDRTSYAAMCRAIVDRFGDLRRFGSAQVTLVMLASGVLDGVVSIGPAHPWDSVAGVHLIREAGGTVTNTEGDRWRHDSDGLVASNGEIHDELLDLVDEIRA